MDSAGTVQGHDHAFRRLRPDPSEVARSRRTPWTERQGARRRSDRSNRHAEPIASVIEAESLHPQMVYRTDLRGRRENPAYRRSPQPPPITGLAAACVLAWSSSRTTGVRSSSPRPLRDPFMSDLVQSGDAVHPILRQARWSGRPGSTITQSLQQGRLIRWMRCWRSSRWVSGEEWRRRAGFVPCSAARRSRRGRRTRWPVDTPSESRRAPGGSAPAAVMQPNRPRPRRNAAPDRSHTATSSRMRSARRPPSREPMPRPDRVGRRRSRRAAEQQEGMAVEIARRHCFRPTRDVFAANATDRPIRSRRAMPGRSRPRRGNQGRPRRRCRRNAEGRFRRLRRRPPLASA